MAAAGPSRTVLVDGDVRGLGSHHCARLPDQRERVDRVHCTARGTPGRSPRRRPQTCLQQLWLTRRADLTVRRCAARCCKSDSPGAVECKGTALVLPPDAADAADYEPGLPSSATKQRCQFGAFRFASRTVDFVGSTLGCTMVDRTTSRQHHHF